MNKSAISVAALQKILEAGEQVVILDVRPQDQRDEWKIAGSIYKDAYAALNAGDTSILDDLDIPPKTPVVTVCAAGRTSQIAANVLIQKGYDAQSLQGGMKAWNYAWNTAETVLDDVTVIQVRRVAKGCLSYIIGSGDEAIVIDAALDPGVYMQLAKEKGWQIRYATDTHIHADYVSRTIELAKASNAIHLFSKTAVVNYPFTPIEDGETIPIGSATLKVVYTPGHTPESTSFLLNDTCLFTGDTLFTDGVGRPDLKADRQQALEKAAQLFHSLGKIMTLSDHDLLILPAHTAQAVDFNKKLIVAKLSELVQKMELLQLQKETFITRTLERIPPTPSNYLQIAAINKTGNHEGIDLAELEAGANRCSVS